MAETPIRLLHISDIHLGIKPTFFDGSFFDFQIEILRSLLQRASQQGLSYVLISGDLFDSNRESDYIVEKTLALFQGFSNLHFIIIPGGGSEYKEEVTGHDAYTEDSIYKRAIFLNAPSNIHLLTPENPKLTLGDITFYGGFFSLPKTNKSESSYHVAVVHGSVGKDDGFIKLHELDQAFYDYIALGHFHKCKRVSQKSAYAGVLIPFEFPSYFGELKGSYIVVELSRGAVRINEKHLDNSTQFIKRRVDALEELKTLLESCHERTFLHLILPKDFKETVNELLKAIPQARRSLKKIDYEDEPSVSLDFFDTLSVVVENFKKERNEEIIEKAEEFIVDILYRRRSLDTINDFIERVKDEA